jgi:hypothetical protein
VFGWGREPVERGLAEKRTGLTCSGAQSAYCGRQRWEERQPGAAAALRQLAETQAQQDPTFRTVLSYTRLTAKAAREALLNQDFGEEQLPSPSTRAELLTRLGYRLRKVVKAKPRKKLKETDALFGNIKKKDHQALEAGNIKRLSMGCKAMVAIGEFSRGGLTRGDNKACDHDLATKKNTPLWDYRRRQWPTGDQLW